MKVLIVDDLAASADTLQMVLELEDHQVATARDGKQALEQVQEFVPDVVLLDIGLPDMNGYEVARQMRALTPGKSATLIALTGYGDADSLQRSRDAGFDHHLVKPADIEQLLKMVAEAKPNPAGG